MKILFKMPNEITDYTLPSPTKVSISNLLFKIASP